MAINKGSGSAAVRDLDTGLTAKVEPKGTGEQALHVIAEIASVISGVSLANPEHFNGTVSTTPIDVPTVAGNAIYDIIIKNPATNTPSENLEVSFDGGTTYFVIKYRETLASENNGTLTQVKIKGSTAAVDYEVIVKRLA